MFSSLQWSFPCSCSYHVFALGGVVTTPLTIIMNVIKSGTYSRAATKWSVASIQVNVGTIYQLVQVNDEYRYECPMCTGTGIWQGWKQAFV